MALTRKRISRAAVQRRRDAKAARRRARLGGESPSERDRREHRHSERVILGEQMLRDLVEKRKAPRLHRRKRLRPGQRAEV